MKSYIKPQSTTINFDLRDSLLLNNSQIGASATERSDSDAALSQQKESAWSSSSWDDNE